MGNQQSSINNSNQNVYHNTNNIPQQNIPQQNIRNPNNRHMIPQHQHQPQQQPQQQRQVNYPRNNQLNVNNPSSFHQYKPPIAQNYSKPQKQIVKNNNHKQPISMMNVNDRIQQFQQREMTEEEQFKKAQERLKEVFKKRQEERRRRFYAEVESFEKGYENPYKILGIGINADHSTLRKAYKQMAIQYHPDKGGDPKIFKKITQAYIYVLDKLEKSKKMSRTFEEAKQEFEKPTEEYIDKQVEETVKKFNLDKDNFNLNKFNQLFEEFRINDPNDKGYGEGWEEDNDDKHHVFDQKFNKDVFNKVFDDANDKRFKKYSGKGTIMKYEEPQAQMSFNSTGAGFSEIGVDDILNFTGTSGDLNFTDYKAAYTYDSTIEKPDMNRKQYKNVKELEAERDNISYKISAEEEDRQRAIKSYNDKLEEQRRMNINRYDQQVQDQYRRIHSNLLTK